jgi:membrane fusion protein (multidrug efflux system)
MSKRAGRGLIVIIVILALIAIGGAHYMMTRGQEKTEDATIEANVIPVAPKVSGYVVELDVTDNQRVKKGDVLLKIDPRDYQIALDQAKADLASAESRLAGAKFKHAGTSVSAPSNLESAQSQVAAAEAEWKNADKTLKRLQSLNDTARSQQSLDDASAAEKSARSKLEDAKARLRSAQTAPDEVAASEASVKELEAALEHANAAVEQAQNNLDDTTVVASQDGRITRRSVEQGAYVEEGQQLLSLVGNTVWVIANFKETQLDGMKAGQAVDIHIDAYPSEKFEGKVDSVQAGTGARFSLFPPENATGNFVKIVQRVPVKIVFTEQPPAELQVGPGMSVVPTVHVQ